MISARVKVLNSRYLTVKICIAISFLALLIIFFLQSSTTNAACTPVADALGKVDTTISVASAGTYTVWTRMQPGSVNTNDSYVLEVDGSICGVIVGNATNLAANTWTWVNYRDGNTSNKITLNLTAGSHTISMIGREDGVKIDRVMLLANASCVPSGNGDNCGSAQDSIVPTATITSPANNANVSSTINIGASASDNVSVARLEIYVDNVMVKTVNNALSTTHALNTTTLVNGPHTIFARAYDTNNNVGNSPTITINVNNAGPADTTAPTNVAITAPANGATISGTSTMITSSASDDVGVAKVEFYINATLLGTDTTAPYTFGLDTTKYANGSYQLISKAYDAANNSRTSTAVGVTINNLPPADTTNPVVSLTSPIAGTVLSGNATLSALATDNVAVTKVVFYVDNVIRGSSTTSPYQYTLDTKLFVNGTHSVFARAYDLAGNTAKSTTIAITISNSTANNPTPAPTKPGDANGDGRVNFKDLAILLGKYGKKATSIAEGDLNGDGTIDFKDLAILLGNYNN